MSVKKGERDKRELEEESSREIKAVVDYRRMKFGEEEVRNATGALVKPGKDHRTMGEEMVTGGKGYRQFLGKTFKLRRNSHISLETPTEH